MLLGRLHARRFLPLGSSAQRVRVACPLRRLESHTPQRRVHALAKRSRKQTEDEYEEAEDEPSSWDTALAGVPMNMDAAAGDLEEDEDALDEMAAVDEMEALEGIPDPSEVLEDDEVGEERPPGTDGEDGGQPSTSYAPVEEPKKKKKKKTTSIMTLAEYKVLMDAVAQKEARIAAEDGLDSTSTAVAIPEDAALTLNRQGFQAFQMDQGLEFLVAETVDNKLMMADSYVFAPGDSYYARPTLAGEVTAEALSYHCIPWTEITDPDVLKHKDGKKTLKKVYFLGWEGSDEDPVMDLGNVYVFDAARRTLSHEEVKIIGDNLREPVLRIRPQGVTLEEAMFLPDPFKVSEGTAGMDMTEEEVASRMEELERELAEKEEMMDEFDEAPDVPSVDMM